MARFVLLYHECPAGYVRSSHWDLMLESGGVLRTWALTELPRAWQAVWERTSARFPSCPALAQGDAVSAEALADHRIEYLHEEGALSGVRGEVRRVEKGTYGGSECVGRWRVTLNGELWRGGALLADGRLVLR